MVIRIVAHFRLFVCVLKVLLCIIISTQFSCAQIDTLQQLKEVSVKGIATTKTPTISPSQVLNSAEFQRVNAYNVADALRNFSGVNIKDYGGIGGLKTVSVRSLGAHHTGVQFDGVTVTDTQNGQIDLGKFNLDNVQSITLSNGLTGDICQPARSFASASMVSIKGINPQVDASKPTKITTGIKFGSFGLLYPSLQWQQRINTRLSAIVSSNFQSAHGKYTHKVQGDGSDTLALRTNADLRVQQHDLAFFWKQNDHSNLKIRANYTHSDRGLPGAVVFYNPYTNQHLWNRDFFLQTNYETTKKEIRSLLQGKYTYNYTRYLDPDYLNIAGELDQRYKQQEVYGTASMAWKINGIVDLAYATDLSLTSLSTNNYGFAYPTRLTSLHAFTGQFKHKGLHAQATLLSTYIHESVQTGKAADDSFITSPAVAVEYKATSESPLIIRAFYKDIFRYPTFNDLYYVRSGNRTLLPERTHQFNLGAVYKKDGKGKLEYIEISADAYYNNVIDKIIAVPNKDLFTWTMLNLGRVDIRGIDFSASAHYFIHQDLTAKARFNYTFQEALDVTDKQSTVYLHQIPYTPRHSFSGNFGLEYKKFALYCNQSYSSHRYYLSENIPAHYVPGFFVTDASLRNTLQIRNRVIKSTIEVNNLFNTSYAFIRSFPMPGRSYRFSIQFTI